MRRVTARRGETTPSMLSHYLDELGVETGDDFCIVPAIEFEGEIGAVGPHGNKPTSRDAAYFNAPRRGTQRERVIAALLACQYTGATRDELAEMLDMRPNVLTPRVWELVKGGFAEETSRTRKTRDGAQAVVLVATPKARDQIGAS
jgi:hypothetical protein